MGLGWRSTTDRDTDTQEKTDQNHNSKDAAPGAQSGADGMGGHHAPPATPRDRGWIARLTGYCWHYPRNVTLAVIGTLVVSAVGISIPLIQRAIVDNLTSPGHAAIWPLALALIGAAVANFAGVYVRR